MKWYVIRNPNFMGISSGWGNGYVAVPPSHCLHGHCITDYNSEIHGGITYSGYGYHLNAPKGWWIFGFDTVHFGDDLEKWSKEAVEEETKKLFHYLFEIEWGEL
jgi:hypothetical protein